MDNFTSTYGFSQQEWITCLKVLQRLKEQPFDNPDNQQFSGLITKIHKRAKKQAKEVEALKRKASDQASISATSIVKNALQNKTNFAATNAEESTYTPLHKSRNCYCCNQAYNQLHSFYHKLCPECATINYAHRELPIDLSGRKIILTGGRVKIGYATALKILRSQGELTVTTRFPALAMEQFQKEKDYLLWKNRLVIYGLDLRNLKAVNAFIQYYKTQNDQLDILINNAAQTIKYDEAYYQPLINAEHELQKALAPGAAISPNHTPVLQELQPTTTAATNFLGVVNRFGQPVDHREKNSWNSGLAEIELPELLEVNLINQISPYLLIKELTPLLKVSSFAERFIINVTSSEGQFSYLGKTKFHPHTNMTKAALNMLTRTSAQEYVEDNIYVNSVDVGWVSTGAHEKMRAEQFKRGQVPPLDPVDGSARILHPIYETLHNKTIFTGQLLKDFKPVDW